MEVKPGYKLTEVGVIPEPGGFIAISRWLSEATPPVADGRGFRIPAGCQSMRHDDMRGVSRAGLRSLRDRGFCAHVFRGCRCAQPPANGWHPFEMTGRVRQLADRYAAPLPQLVDEVTALAATVDGHFRKREASWK